ncbi:hypothetical protein C1646_722301, partial [Rhizophagus diaphanus]
MALNLFDDPAGWSKIYCLFNKMYLWLVKKFSFKKKNKQIKHFKLFTIIIKIAIPWLCISGHFYVIQLKKQNLPNSSKNKHGSLIIQKYLLKMFFFFLILSPNNNWWLLC